VWTEFYNNNDDDNNNNNNNNNSHLEQLASTEYAKRHDGVAEVIHQKLAEAAELIEDRSPYLSTHQLMYCRTTTSSCTGIAA
jgi:hypothetical protein